MLLQNRCHWSRLTNYQIWWNVAGCICSYWTSMGIPGSTWMFTNRLFKSFSWGQDDKMCFNNLSVLYDFLQISSTWFPQFMLLVMFSPRYIIDGENKFGGFQDIIEFYIILLLLLSVMLHLTGWNLITNVVDNFMVRVCLSYRFFYNHL